VKLDDSTGFPYRVMPWGYQHRAADDRFFELVKAMSVAMADRCQDGLLDHDAFGKTVVAAAGSVMVEFLYVSGERQRPLSPEEVRKEINRLREEVSKK
jgi:2-methylcitrate dehydratase PrpD